MEKQSTLYANVLKARILRRQTKRKAMALAAAVILVTSIFSAAFAAGGDLDTSFDLDGIAITDMGLNAGTSATAIQADGKALAAGTTSSDSTADFALVRYNTDGRPDPAFGTDGKVVTSFGDKDHLSGITIQPDGRVILVGTTAPADTPNDTDMALSRHKVDGSLDTTFASSGKLIFSLASPVYANDIALQSDGKIVVAGYISLNPTALAMDFFVARFTSSGALDTAFGGGAGFVITDFFAPVDQGWRVVIQSDGRIVVAGRSYDSSFSAFVMARYNTNGSLDASFGSGGKVITQIFSSMGWMAELLLLGNGKLILAGTTSAGASQPGDKNLTLIRYNTNGSLDTSFGSAGSAYVDVGNAPGDDEARAAAVQSDGKIVVGGSTGDYPYSHSCLARFNASGSLDTSFGIGGSVITEVDDLDSCSGVAIQGDGRIVASIATSYRIVAPNGTIYTYPHNFAVARYLDGGAPQPADLSIQMTDSPDPVNLNGILTYSITLTNNEFLSPKAVHVTMQDTIPKGTTFLSLQAPSGWVVYEKPAVGASGKISCSSYTLGAGQTAQFTVAVRVRSGSTISNTALVKSLTPDPITGNNKVTSVTNVN